MSRGASSARWVVMLHETAAVGQQQMAAFAAHRLADQEGLGVRVIQAGRVELDELHVGHPAAGAPGHGDAVAGRGVRVGGVEVDLAGAAGGEHGVAGGEGLDLARALVQRVDAEELPLLAAGAPAGDEIDGDVLLEGVMLGWAARGRAGWSAPHRRWRPPRGPHGAGVAAFARQMQTAGRLRVGGEGDAVLRQPGDHLARLADHQPGDRLVAEAGAGDQGVVHVRLERVAAVDRRCDPALRPVAGALGHLALGDNGDAALVGKLERGGERGEAAAEDEDVVSMHGVAG